MAKQRGNQVTFTENLDVEVSVSKQGNESFTVVYGAERHIKLSYEEACKELGACILHSLHCKGKFDH